MEAHAAFDAAMECPLCSHVELPTDDSSNILAWYECARCGHQWSARLRGGRPVPAASFDIPVPHAP